MVLTKKNALWLAMGLLVVTLYNACAPFKSGGGAIGTSLGQNSQQFSEETFSKTLHPVLRTHCAQCHGVNQNPKHSVENFSEAHQVVMSNRLVDLNIPSNSYLLTKLNAGHNNVSVEVINEMLLQISAWAQAMREFDLEQTPDQPIQFSAASESSVLLKLKAISHGGALTNPEWNQMTQGELTRNRLKALVENWIETPEGQAKMDQYIQMALGQDITLNEDSDDLFRRVRDGRFQANLRESFSRTVRDLIDRDRPFTEIATTRRIAVTTALLAAYAYMENNRPNRNGFNDLVRGRGEHQNQGMQDSDFTDWRFITIQETTQDNVAAYSDLDNWRSIANNATLQMRIPRVGYFSTLAFQARFPTNDDNQFRVITNQTLIAGLGRTFNPNDPTSQPMPIGIPADHAQPNTQCYGCHRLMDPMRIAFGMKMSYNYRFGSTFQENMASFAFDDFVSPMSNIRDLGTTIASHPKFAEAWVQKMCQAFNTNTCAIADPEFQAVVQRFSADSFNFKNMYVDLITSNLVTGAATTTTSETIGFNVARTRRNHFCHSLEAKQRQILEARGRTPANFSAGNRICNDRNVRNSMSAIGDDLTVRGVENVINSFPVDAFTMQAMERSCQGFAVYFANNNNGISIDENNVNESVDLLTRFLVGLPTNHPRHDMMRAAIRATYDQARNNHNMSARDALREAVTLACAAPDTMGMGL